MPFFIKSTWSEPFRNLKIDPYVYPLLGLHWKQCMYIDVSVPFGFDTGAALCQLEFLGLPLNDKKIEEQTEQIPCLGINVNARTGFLSIPTEKNVGNQTIVLTGLNVQLPPEINY